MSEEEISAPTTAQYRTVPLRPLNVTVDKASITSSSFKIMWDPPKRQRYKFESTYVYIFFHLWFLIDLNL